MPAVQSHTSQRARKEKNKKCKKKQKIRKASLLGRGGELDVFF